MFGSWRGLTRRRVIVNTAERAFNGVLWSARRDLLVLRNVELLEPGAAPREVDGEVVVERARVEFIQFVQVVG